MLKKSESFMSLVKNNPFPDSPPKYARIIKYYYKFTDEIEGKNNGNWWKRERPSTYLSPVTANSSQFVSYLKQLNSF